MSVKLFKNFSQSFPKKYFSNTENYIGGCGRTAREACFICGGGNNNPLNECNNHSDCGYHSWCHSGWLTSGIFSGGYEGEFLPRFCVDCEVEDCENYCANNPCGPGDGFCNPDQNDGPAGDLVMAGGDSNRECTHPSYMGSPYCAEGFCSMTDGPGFIQGSEGMYHCCSPGGADQSIHNAEQTACAGGEEEALWRWDSATNYFKNYIDLGVLQEDLEQILKITDYQVIFGDPYEELSEEELYFPMSFNENNSN